MAYIVITKLNGKTVRGVQQTAKATVTLSDGTQRAFDGKINPGQLYNGGELPDGISIHGSSSDGEFAWTLMGESDVQLITNPAK